MIFWKGLENMSAVCCTFLIEEYDVQLLLDNLLFCLKVQNIIRNKLVYYVCMAE